jgi:BlaI family transcriptional regulator, penicillinase repressor
MKLVWERENATVRDVYEALLERRRIAYTTVMTMMKILETKGYLKKRRQDRAFLYRPAHPKNQVIGGMIREFIDRVFNGSAEPLLLHLVKSRGIGEKDLEKIVRMIEETK